MLSSLSREEYEKLDAINYSSIKRFAESPAHYLEGLRERADDTSAMKLGRVRDLLVFGGAEKVAIWRNGDRRAKGYKEFEAQSAGLEVVTLSEWEECEAFAKAVKANPLAAKYLEDGHPKLCIQWEDGGLKFKGELDFLSTSCPAVCDLKSTVDASPDGFAKQFARYLYAAQGAMYVDGVKTNLGEELPYVVIAAEHFAPYAVTVFRVPPDVLDLGRSMYRRWVKRLVECREKNSFPPYSETEVTLQLPVWAFGDQP